MRSAAPAGGTAPVLPTPTSAATHRPVDSGAISNGFWADRQRQNRSASVPLGIAKLEEAGNYDNLRLAAGDQIPTDFRGPDYMDSDIYKMLESAAYLLEDRDDPELRRFIDRATELITRAQDDNGYLNSRYQRTPEQRFTRLTNSHELYTAGHLFQAAIALDRSAGDDRLLGVACRLADHLVQVFLTDRLPRLDGHPQAETALVELYRSTGTAAYLELACRLLDDRGHGLVGAHSAGAAYQQDALPVRQMPILTGHAVRAMYLEAGVVDGYLETGDRSLLDASIRRWEDMVATKTAITGGHGARTLKEAFGEGYELPPDQSYNETCAAVASIHWSWRLLLATGQARFADLIERTLYNVFTASVSLDGREFFKGNPLQRRHDHEQVIGDPRYRGAWFWSACCPPNVTRMLGSLQHYLASATGDQVFLHQYASSQLTIGLDTGTVRLAVESELPWSGRVRVAVQAAPETPWTLALRMPTWSSTATVVINGRAEPVSPGPDGYLTLAHAWRAGDTIELTLDVTARMITPHRAIDAVRGCIAIQRGPLVYCFEQADQPAGTDVERLSVTAGAEITERPVDDHPGIGRSVLLELPATVVDQPADGLPYFAESPQPTRRSTTATAVPYFQWSNRDRAPMRVWLPIAHS